MKMSSNDVTLTIYDVRDVDIEKSRRARSSPNLFYVWEC